MCSVTQLVSWLQFTVPISIFLMKLHRNARDFNRKTLVQQVTACESSRPTSVHNHRACSYCRGNVACFAAAACVAEVCMPRRSHVTTCIMHRPHCCNVTLRSASAVAKDRNSEVSEDSIAEPCLGLAILTQRA